jgi:glycosyltransferase involved in cell wall biosynthesis
VKIYSPVATGSGAIVVHQNLADRIPDYTLQGIDPRWSVFTPLLKKYSRDCDVVHTAPDMGGAVLSGANKVVLTFHNYYLDKAYLSSVDVLRRAFYRTALHASVSAAVKKADCLVAVSHATAALVKNDFGVDCYVIENGVDAGVFKPSSDTQANDKTRILFSGNPSTRKGKSTLIDVANHLPENCVLSVTGGLRKEGSNNTAGSGIEWLPRVPYAEMYKLYQQADLLFFPSWREGLSLVILEAMACGLPVVTTNISSMPELIDHELGGYLYTPGDSREALKYLNELANDPHKRKLMGEYNRQKILKKYTIETMVSKYEEVFHSCCTA